MGTSESTTAAAGGEQHRSGMSHLFRRSRTEGAVPPPAPAPLPATGVVCTLAGCSNDNAQPCAYRDGRGRPCRAAHCPQHGVVSDGKFYCRRHAGVMRAVGAEATPQGGLPDVDNRAPSLVNWIARDLDENVRRLLTGVARPGESVIADETVHVARDFNRKARWEQRLAARRSHRGDSQGDHPGVRGERLPGASARRERGDRRRHPTVDRAPNRGQRCRHRRRAAAALLPMAGRKHLHGRRPLPHRASAPELGIAHPRPPARR